MQTSATTIRQPDAPVHGMFVSRWSPRAFSGDAVDQATLDSLFEAARWAPSSFNAQPWRFYVSTDGAERLDFNDTIMPFNRAWAEKAGALIFVAAKTTFDHNGAPNRHAEFDTGSATMQLILQAQELGLVSHAMGGFDSDAAARVLDLPADQKLICVLALGHPGDAASLPEKLREREQPSDRKPTSEFVVGP